MCNHIVVPGPNPALPCEGQTILDPKHDIWPLQQHGQMFNGFVTSAFLNLVISPHFKDGVRRISDSFYFIFRQQLSLSMSCASTAWAETTSQLSATSLGHFVDFDADPLIFIQIFVGSPQSGHFSLLVFDKRCNRSLVTYFDSIKSMSTKTFHELQMALKGTPMDPTLVHWIEADMVQQGVASNDCGVFMSMVALVYVKTFSTGSKLPQVDVLSGAKVWLSGSETADTFGIKGRKVMLESLQNGTLSSKSIDWVCGTLTLKFLEDKQSQAA